MGFVDDSQLIQSFAQFSLMNQNPNYGQNTIDMYQMPVQNSTNSNDISLENNFSNYGQQLSSVPAHMSNPKMNRSHSINRVPEGSQYLKENFLFEKIGEKTSKDDTTIKIYQNPITIEQNDAQFQPIMLKNHKLDPEVQSNSSYSSKSSMVSSFNDNASCSSLEMSFDGSGNPYIKPYRTSAFAKVKSDVNGDCSNSQDSDDYKNQEKEKPMELDDKQAMNKSSFFRLKDNTGG